MERGAGAWSNVNTVTGSESGGGRHSLLLPLSLHHQTSPPYYGQHVSQLSLYWFVVISVYIQHSAHGHQPATTLLHSVVRPGSGSRELDQVEVVFTPSQWWSDHRLPSVICPAQTRGNGLSVKSIQDELQPSV